MKWRQDLNETYFQDGKVHYKIFAEGEGLNVKRNGSDDWGQPNIEKDGVQGWHFIVEPNGWGLDFHISEWGFSQEPNVEIPIEPLPEEPKETVLFSEPNKYPNSYYIAEPTDWVRLSKEPQVVKGMNGYDFAPIQLNRESEYRFNAWEQDYISIGRKDIWQEDGKTYFLSPNGYKTDVESHLMDFDLKFPEFAPPKEKIVVVEPTPSRQNKYLSHGCSFAKNEEGVKRFEFVSDGWLYDLGCPQAYNSSQEDFDTWAKNIDADVLLEKFKSAIYGACKDYGYVMLNWEAVGHKWRVDQWKIVRCLQYWQSNPHKAKLGLWTVSGIGIGRPIFQGLGIDFTPMLEFNGTLEEFQKQFGNYVGIDFVYAKYVELGYIGGYQNYPIEEGIIHHYLTELLLHRKFNPNKTILATIWFDQEFIGQSFEIGRKRVDYEEGSYFAEVKPKVAPSTMFNWGVWSMLGDGFDCWSDGNTWSLNKADWGWGSRDLNGNILPEKYGENHSKYPSQPMKNIDWLMRGVWCMSENKDIVEYDSQWNFAILPTRAFHNKSVLIAYKLKGNEVLALALDGFAGIDEVKSHEFKVGISKYSIKTYGRFTSVIRFKL